MSHEQLRPVASQSEGRCEALASSSSSLACSDGGTEIVPFKDNSSSVRSTCRFKYCVSRRTRRVDEKAAADGLRVQQKAASSDALVGAQAHAQSVAGRETRSVRKHLWRARLARAHAQLTGRRIRAQGEQSLLHGR